METRLQHAPEPTGPASEGFLAPTGQPRSARISCLLAAHRPAQRCLEDVQRSRAPYSVTQLSNLSDLVTAGPLSPLITRANFDARCHLVSGRCRCDYILDGKSSPSIRGARGCDGGRKPHEKMSRLRSSGVSRPNSLVGLVHFIVPWTMTRSPSIGTQKKASSLHGTTTDGSPNLNKASLPRGDSAQVTTMRTVRDPHAIGPNIPGCSEVVRTHRNAPDRRG